MERKEKRRQPKEKEVKDSLEVSSSGEREIVIEDNMKIELLVKEEPIDWDDEEDMTNDDPGEPLKPVSSHSNLTSSALVSHVAY